jgi:predicted heme/steroid binding protein
MKKFLLEEVAQCNGKNGNPVYVLFKGKVYDVSASFLWKDGTHQVLHSAGVDLTNALEHAPHGRDVLEKFPVVGILHDAGMSSTQSKP